MVISNVSWKAGGMFGGNPCADGRSVHNHKHTLRQRLWEHWAKASSSRPKNLSVQMWRCWWGRSTLQVLIPTSLFSLAQSLRRSLRSDKPVSFPSTYFCSPRIPSSWDLSWMPVFCGFEIPSIVQTRTKSSTLFPFSPLDAFLMIFQRRRRFSGA